MFNVDYETSEAASIALNRIKDRKSQALLENVEANNKSSISRERDYLEEFSEHELQTKLKSDKYIYDVILSNIQESENTSELFSGLITKMTNVYRILNVAPQPYQFIESEIVNGSELSNTSKASNIIKDYMKDNLYCISQESREIRYKEKVVNIATEFVESHNSPADAAIDLAYKVVVCENLLNEMHFPKFIKLYLEDCLSSDKYAEFFEADTLADAYNEYVDASHVAAQLIATTL